MARLGYNENPNYKREQFVIDARAIPYIKNAMTIPQIKDWYDCNCDYVPLAMNENGKPVNDNGKWVRKQRKVQTILQDFNQ